MNDIVKINRCNLDMKNFGKTKHVGKQYFYRFKNNTIRISVFRVKKGYGYRWFLQRHRTKDFWFECRLYFFGFDIAIFNKISNNGLGSYEDYIKGKK